MKSFRGIGSHRKTLKRGYDNDLVAGCFLKSMMIDVETVDDTTIV